MKFLTDNILLVLLAAVSGLMLIWPMLRRGAMGVPDIGPADAVTLINRKHAVVLDVRDDTEFAAGHITDAKHIPLAQLESRLGELEKFKSKPLVVQCQGGVRSATACALLKKHGFDNLHNLRGGLNAWMEAKLPVTKD